MTAEGSLNKNVLNDFLYYLRKEEVDFTLYLYNFNFKEKYCKKPRPNILRLFSRNVFFKSDVDIPRLILFVLKMGFTVGKSKKLSNPTKLHLSAYKQINNV